MIKSAKVTLIYLAALLVFTSAAVSFRTAALITSLDSALIYFENTIALYVSVLCVALFVILSLSYLFTQEKKFKPAISFENPQTYISSGLVGVSFVLMSANLWGKVFESNAKTTSTFNTSYVILLVIAMLAVVSTFNFFLNCFQEKRESSVRAAFSIGCAAFLGFYAGYLFFSEALPINAPNKAVDQLAYLGLAIFMLYEARISLGRSKWRAYVVFGLIASILALYSSIPAIIFYFATGNVVSNSIAENILTLTLGIYIISRLTLTVTAVRDEMCPAALAIADLTTARSAELASKERIYGKITPKEDEEETNNGTEGENYEFDFFEISRFTSDHNSSTEE